MIKKGPLFISAVLFIFMCAISPAETHPKSNQGKALSDPVERSFFIQVGSYKKLPNAEDQVSFLHSKDVKAFWVQEKAGRKGKYFRVYLGPYQTREKAQNSAQGFLSEGIISSFWIKNKSLPAPGLSISRPADHHLRPTATSASDENLFELSGMKNSEILLLSSRSKTVKPSEPGDLKKHVSQVVSQDNTTDDQQPAAVQKKEEVQSRDQTGGNKESGNGPLSIEIRAGINSTPNVEDLYILSGGSVYRFQFSQSRLSATLSSSLSLTKRLSIEAGYGRALATELDYWFLTFGPRFYPVRSSAFSPYIRAGLLWADLSWDKIPGDFKQNFGFEGGIGLEYSIKRYRLGGEISYRHLEFEYEPPPGVLSNRDSLDFSGFSFMGAFTYFF